MTPPLPEGARLALLHWPWGTPDCRAIVLAAGTDRRGHRRRVDHVVIPLRRAGLIEWGEPGIAFRLTRAGRRALDEIQSGEAGDACATHDGVS